MEDVNVTYRAELLPGTTLYGGKYTIERKIGQGGFGITYKAVQSVLGRAVCIKEYFVEGKCIRNTQANTVMLQSMGKDAFEKYRKAFVQEARTLAQLHHPGIVEVVDVFDENGTSYMVMPFIEGRSLQSIVEKNGPLIYPEAVNYIAQIANAAGYIHERNILHRDIKPDNIMVTADAKAILIDFGSARKFEHDKTQSHTSILTPGYAPVEQYNTNSRKGSYTDIYAIGATMYFLVTGKQPMDSPVRYTERMPEPKELNPNVPDDGNRTILKAMQIKAENRHQTVQEFMDDLCGKKPSVLVDETIGGGTPTQPNNGSSKKPLIGILVAVFVVIVGLVFFLAQGKGESEPVEKGPDPTMLANLHEEKVKELDRDLPYIVTGRDGVTHGNTETIINALNKLAEIERMENGPHFYKTGLTPVFKQKFSVYKNNLSGAEMELEKQINELIGLNLSRDKYTIGLEERLERLRRIKNEADGGSAISVKESLDSMR